LKKLIYLVLVLAGLTACVTPEAWLPTYTVPFRPKVSWEEVRVYQSADQVPGKYEEVAQLTVEMVGRDVIVEDALRSLRKRAGRLGANAIIFQVRRKSTAIGDDATLGLADLASPIVAALAIFILPEENGSWTFPG